jgi:hypothetical protein
MSAKPLADAYERLKELRREGGLNPGVQSKGIYEDVVRQGLPDRFTDLIKKLDVMGDTTGKSDPSAELIRTLEIKTLADRVFADEDKADAWLQRPNLSVSGQRPADLLKDELGTAVVREMLERIDHGIFA